MTVIEEMYNLRRYTGLCVGGFYLGLIKLCFQPITASSCLQLTGYQIKNH